MLIIVYINGGINLGDIYMAISPSLLGCTFFVLLHLPKIEKNAYKMYKYVYYLNIKAKH